MKPISPLKEALDSNPQKNIHFFEKNDYGMDVGSQEWEENPLTWEIDELKQPMKNWITTLKHLFLLEFATILKFKIPKFLH